MNNFTCPTCGTVGPAETQAKYRKDCKKCYAAAMRDYLHRTGRSRPRLPAVVNGKRVCRCCHIEKPVAEFGVRNRKSTPDHARNFPNYESKCGTCLKAWSAERRKKMGPETKKKQARYMRHWAYGVTPEKYEAMFASQEGKCAICRAVLKTGTRWVHIDHCHTTGVVRGILCNHCNNGLGHFRDNADYLESAAKYLRQKRE